MLTFIWDVTGHWILLFMCKKPPRLCVKSNVFWSPAIVDLRSQCDRYFLWVSDSWLVETYFSIESDQSNLWYLNLNTEESFIFKPRFTVFALNVISTQCLPSVFQTIWEAWFLVLVVVYPVWMNGRNTIFAVISHCSYIIHVYILLIPLWK